MPLLFVLAAACFIGSFSIRLLDPVVPQIARDLAVLPATVALLASAFAFPYALAQPVLGPLGDAVGKARIIKICIGVLALSLAASALAPTYEVLFAARMVAGLAGGGIIPLALATVGDRFAFAERQVALSHLLSAMLIAQLVGVIGSGLVASLLGWRMVLAIATLVTLAVLALTVWRLEPRVVVERRPFNLASMRGGYTQVFANARAKICFAAVFVEGIVVFGLLPYVATLLEERGAGGIREAGFVLAGLGLGGLIYTVSVKRLLNGLGGMLNLMRVGGLIAALGLVVKALAGLYGLAWPADMAAFVLVGCGFYMVHASLQTQATELAPDNRGAAVSLHAFFFFLGHAAGPPVYAVLLATVGSAVTVVAMAAVFALLGFATAAALAARD